MKIKRQSPGDMVTFEEENILVRLICEDTQSSEILDMNYYKTFVRHNLKVLVGFQLN